MLYDRMHHDFKDEDLISGSKLAEILGVSPAAISKARFAGRLDTWLNSKGRECYHKVISPKQFLSSRNLSKVTGPTRSQKASGIDGFGAQLESNSLNFDPDKVRASEQESFDYADARAERETHQARLMKLKADEAEGKLVNKDEAGQKVYALASSVKDRMMAIHLKIAPIVVSNLEQSMIASGMKVEDARRILSAGKLDAIVGETIRKHVIEAMHDILEKTAKTILE